MAGSCGRFRGRHGPGRGPPADHCGRSGNAAGSGRGAPIAADRSGASQAGGRGGSPPAGATVGCGGPPPTVVVDGRGAADARSRSFEPGAQCAGGSQRHHGRCCGRPTADPAFVANPSGVIADDDQGK
jgi:hypothetical protein